MHCLSHDIDDIYPEDWNQHAWRERWENSNYQLNNIIAYPCNHGHDIYVIMKTMCPLGYPHNGFGHEWISQMYVPKCA